MDDLTENHEHNGENQNKWYFFTPTKGKYTKGKYTNREALDGYWEVTGSEKKIKKPKTKIAAGYKKQLVFYEYEREGRRLGKKTNWIMHEYRVSDSQVSRFYPLFFNLFIYLLLHYKNYLNFGFCFSNIVVIIYCRANPY